MLKQQTDFCGAEKYVPWCVLLKCVDIKLFFFLINIMMKWYYYLLRFYLTAGVG